MAYVRGTVKVETQESLADLYGAPDPGEEHTVNDVRGRRRWAPPVAVLPHSCDAWVIGGRAEVELLIADLEEVLRDELGDPVAAPAHEPFAAFVARLAGLFLVDNHGHLRPRFPGLQELADVKAMGDALGVEWGPALREAPAEVPGD